MIASSSRLMVVLGLSCLLLAILPVQADFCLNGPGEHNADLDLDGVVDCLDNCPLQPNDQTDTDGDGVGDVCDCGVTVAAGDGNSLRVAVSSATADCAIAVPAGVYDLSSNLYRSEGLTLLGAGAGTTVIDRHGSGDVFRIVNQTGHIFIGGVKLTGGWTGLSVQSTSHISGRIVYLSDAIVTGNSPGGGIYVGGGYLDLHNGYWYRPATLHLYNSVVTYNGSTGRGAGIRVDYGDFEGGRLFARHSVIANNNADGDGGGIWVNAAFNDPYVAGEASFTQCKIEGNTTDGNGGGLGLDWMGADATLFRTTVSDNSAVGEGGGIYNGGRGRYASSRAKLIDTTVSGNSSGSNGGGIYNGGPGDFPDSGTHGAELELTNVTVSGNLATHGGGLYNAGSLYADKLGGRISCRNCTITDNEAFFGGGIKVVAANPGTAEFGNSAIASNRATHGADCYGELLSHGHNLLQSDAACVVVGDTIGNILGVDPELGLLQDNGGPTRTHRPGAPLINSANPLAPSDEGLALCPPADQRGIARPVGSACDIGAVEEECPEDATDTDSDGWPDGCDNCPDDPNRRQTDVDMDGIGDLCDICPHDARNDIDADGLCAGDDNCPDLFNDLQEDTDLDLAGDACDCAPLDPTARSPVAVEGLLADKLGESSMFMTWQPAVGADSYSITAGLLSDLAPNRYGVCLVEDLPQEQFEHAGPPPPGVGWIYLVKGVSSACGPGSLGLGAGGSARLNLEPGACP